MQPSIPWNSSVFVTERTAIIHYFKCTVPFSLVVPLLSPAVTHCYSLSLLVTRCITRCHYLTLVAPLVVTRCTTHCSTRCHSLYHSLSFVVTWCTTRLSLYKQSWNSEDICSAWISLLLQNFYFTDWRHMRPKNTIEIFLIYWNVFLGIFSHWL